MISLMDAIYFTLLFKALLMGGEKHKYISTDISPPLPLCVNSHHALASTHVLLLAGVHFWSWGLGGGGVWMGLILGYKTSAECKVTAGFTVIKNGPVVSHVTIS